MEKPRDHNLTRKYVLYRETTKYKKIYSQYKPLSQGLVDLR